MYYCISVWVVVRLLIVSCYILNHLYVSWLQVVMELTVETLIGVVIGCLLSGLLAGLIIATGFMLW